MKRSVKLSILAIVVLFAIYLAYGILTSTSEAIGTFDKFDINSTASKDIKVEIVLEKGITPNQEGGVIFFAKDKNGVEKKISLGKELPPLNNETKFVTLTGHLHSDHFHATEAEFD
jgi:hypothetical protein